MAADDRIRASDVDRDAVVATLREAYTAGRLTIDEFDERMTSAYTGKTWGDLRELTGDLPVQPVLGRDIPGRRVAVPEPLPELTPVAEPDPVDGEAEDLPLPEARPRHSPIRLLVPVAVWMLLLAHGSLVGPGIVIVLVAVFALVSITSSIRRR